MFVPLIVAPVFSVVLNAQFAPGPVYTGDRPPLITSPGICLRELDCPATQFCTLRMLRLADMFVCRDRVGLGEECKLFSRNECQDGLSCQLQSDGQNATCVENIPLGGLCSFTGDVACAGNMTYCRPSDNRCVLKGTARIGQKCIGNNDCQQSRGHYCQAGICASKKATGATCGVEGSYDECEGLCVTGGNPDSAGICAPAQLEGGMCREDYHCKQPVPLFARTERLVCNTPNSGIGRCVRETRLILSLGAACNPFLDTCDSMRGLGCRWAASLNRHVCQQQRVKPAFCTPGSPFSSCHPSSEEICVKDTKDSCSPDPSYEGFFGCRSYEELSPGLPCTTSCRSICSAGSTCESIPGVQFSTVRYGFTTHYCVRTVGIGELCTDKFSTRCDVNLSCVTGRCVISGSPVPTAMINTHADLDGDCSELPCIPGTICRKFDTSDPSAMRTCMLPRIVVKEGQDCLNVPAVIRICARGLVCRRNNWGAGLKLCRKLAPLGAVCLGDTHCKRNLRCAQGYCYDPTVPAPIGLPCDPAAGLGTNRCIVAPSLYDSYSYTFLRCLPKGTGYICQRTARLYEKCDGLLNIGCIDGAVCSSYGVCMPPS